MPAGLALPHHHSMLALALVLLTLELAGPTDRAQLPRNRAIMMPAIDVSLSMNPTDVTPTRVTAVRHRDLLRPHPAPRINLRVEFFTGIPTVLVSLTTNRDHAVHAIQSLKLARPPPPASSRPPHWETPAIRSTSSSHARLRTIAGADRANTR